MPILHPSGIHSNRFSLYVFLGEVFNVPPRKLFDQIISLKPAECHLLDNETAVVVKRTHDEQLIGSEEESEQSINFMHAIFPTSNYYNYQTYFLPVPNYRYSVFLPLLNREVGSRKQVLVRFISFGETAMIPPCEVRDWRSFSIRLSFDSRSSRKVKEIESVMRDWHQAAFTDGICGEHLNDVFVIERHEDGLSFQLSAPQEHIYCFIECYLRLRSRTKTRPLELSFENR